MNYNEQIIESYLQTQSHRKPNSLRSISYDCKVLMEYLNEKNISIFKMSNRDEFTHYADWLETFSSGRTIQRRLCTLRSVIKHCENQGLIAEHNVILSAEQKFSPVLFADTNDLSALLKYCSNILPTDNYFISRNKFMIYFLIILGLKASDLCCINIEDLFEEKIVFVNISGDKEIRLWKKSLYECPLMDYLSKRTEWLKKQKTDSSSLFVDRFGKELSQERVNEAFIAIKKECNIVGGITLSSIRNRCIIDYYDELPDSLLISKIFNITKNRIEMLIESSHKAD